MGGRKGELARETRQVGGSGGMLLQKNLKIQDVAGAFWGGFDTYELRAQLNSAHTRTYALPRIAAAR